MRVTLDAYKVWEFISYAWTEIGIGEEESLSLAREARITVEDLPQVDRIFFRDVCASFAVDSFLIFPLMLWVIMPDWGYSEAYLRKRMSNWYEKPYWCHFLNPLRILGYPVALLIAPGYRSRLRKAVHANASA
ncbi:MAG: hypothetical protein ABI893_11115 [Polaromonas sp.]|uniref:hypothetical protein n=1 Tax=Polaromonas sp. TaxID=1869339 RepID=UPI003262DC8E